MGQESQLLITVKSPSAAPVSAGPYLAFSGWIFSGCLWQALPTTAVSWRGHPFWSKLTIFLIRPDAVLSRIWHRRKGTPFLISLFLLIIHFSGASHERQSIILLPLKRSTYFGINKLICVLVTLHEVLLVRWKSLWRLLGAVLRQNVCPMGPARAPQGRILSLVFIFFFIVVYKFKASLPETCQRPKRLSAFFTLIWPLMFRVCLVLRLGFPRHLLKTSGPHCWAFESSLSSSSNFWPAVSSFKGQYNRL